MPRSSQARLPGALAVFVKTPELSPVKTRLAASIGTARATTFYELSLAALISVLSRLQEELLDFQVYWAVAESEALAAKRWRTFPTVSQGTGGLGQRLDHVYQQLLEKHSYVCFMGADSPQLPIAHLKHAVLETEHAIGNQFILGEAEDGGFYFFGGGIPIPSQTWTAVEYSTPQTAKDLQNQLLKTAPLRLISREFDIDTEEDLRRLSEISTHNHFFTREQIELIQWARTL